MNRFKEINLVVAILFLIGRFFLVTSSTLHDASDKKNNFSIEVINSLIEESSTYFVFGINSNQTFLKGICFSDFTSNSIEKKYPFKIAISLVNQFTYSGLYTGPPREG